MACLEWDADKSRVAWTWTKPKEPIHFHQFFERTCSRSTTAPHQRRSISDKWVSYSCQPGFYRLAASVTHTRQTFSRRSRCLFKCSYTKISILAVAARERATALVKHRNFSCHVLKESLRRYLRMFLIRRNNSTLEVEITRRPAFATGRQLYRARVQLPVKAGKVHAYRNLLWPDLASYREHFYSFCCWAPLGALMNFRPDDTLVKP